MYFFTIAVVPPSWLAELADQTTTRSLVFGLYITYFSLDFFNCQPTFGGNVPFFQQENITYTKQNAPTSKR